MPDWLKVYHQLPYPAKVLAASARGRRLERWRYGPDTERLVDEVLARDDWTPAQWDAWREERLAFVLHRAATRVPYYRDQWARRRAAGDRAAPDVLANWPSLSKDALRAQPHAFLTDDCDPATMYYEHTSGTTGKPLHLWHSRETLNAWYALTEARMHRWYGLSREDRWAILGGQLVAPVERDRPPFWVWNFALRQLYLSAYHLTPDNIAAYLEAIRRHEVVYLLGYPSGLYTLARVALERGLAAPHLRAVIGNAEPLLAHQREAIAAAFGCPARETYGMAEYAAAASDCEHDRLHLWPEAGHVELLADEGDAAVPAGMPGRLVATALLNADMPLIRYETGDRATLATEPCACGRGLPVLAAIEGRVDDMIVTPDGRHIGRLDPVFKADLPIHEAQIIQTTPDTLRVLYVPTAAYTPGDGEALIGRIHDRVGPAMRVVLEAVPAIPRTANGKFRAVISEVNR
ncbi:MAG: AMP-binding protein [Candidatus Promineofilum sp.]|nr:AMP-binding protein [Promineifilum sp.]MCW5861821.1 phenylacetate--CoA ligase family protein [Anaerolineae bacterium]